MRHGGSGFRHQEDPALGTLSAGISIRPGSPSPEGKQGGRGREENGVVNESEDTNARTRLPKHKPWGSGGSAARRTCQMEMEGKARTDVQKEARAQEAAALSWMWPT